MIKKLGLMVLLQAVLVFAKTVAIGVSIPTQREGGWVVIKEEIERYAKEKGYKIRMAVADANTEQQKNQIENLLTQGIDVLVLAPQDGVALSSTVDDVDAEGVPVIALDRMIVNTKNLSYYMSFDNFKVGELQGEFLSKNLKKGNVILLSGAPTDNNSLIFKAGAMTKIQPKIDNGDYKVISEQAVDNWLPSKALKIVEGALISQQNDVQGILAPNDGIAGAAINALATQGLAGKVVVTGLDAEVAAIKRILKGTQSMTVFKDNKVLARNVLDLALRVADGDKVKTTTFAENKVDKKIPAILLKPKVITKSNVQYLFDVGYMKKSDVFEK